MATMLHLAFQFFFFFHCIFLVAHCKPFWFYVCKAELLKLKTSHILEQCKISNWINMSIAATPSLIGSF